MSVHLPVVSTQYTIVTGGGTSTPQEVNLEDGCAEITLATIGNQKVIFLEASVTTPGPQTDFSPATGSRLMMLGKDQFLSFEFPRRSERPGINTFWIWGEGNGDSLIVTQIVRNLQ